ncbi:MAG: homoserine kinase [Candidatus Sericytochromatia bacterium]|nr:homoserine kinase [Candidatus Sericytochromatia bacterium]
MQICVPATSANLGPGYDLLGLALDRYNLFEFQQAEHYQLTFTGPEAAACSFSLDADSLIRQAVEHVYAACQRSAPVFAVRQEVHIPPARGLGSSSSAIVAGLLAANAWLDNPFDKDTLLGFAIEIEGHPDNVAPALLGGCILNLPETQPARYLCLPVPADLHWGVCVPAFELSTAAARAVVPRQVSLNTAVSNSAYLAALVSGLCLNQPETLAWALQDQLHQPYRQALIPGMQAVMQAAREAGALGCVLSGAGPTLLVLAPSADLLEQAGQAMCQRWQAEAVVARFSPQQLDTLGARILTP